MIKVIAAITLEFEAPDGSDVWDLVRNVTSVAVLPLGRRDCREINPKIGKVTANGKPVVFKQKR